VLAVVLNAVATGDHLVKTISKGYWPVTGKDLVLLAGAAIAVYTARRLSCPSVGVRTADADLRPLPARPGR
jgi:hypothetical protein